VNEGKHFVLWKTIPVTWKLQVLEKCFSGMLFDGCSISCLFLGLIVSLEKELTPLFEELRQVVEVS